MSLDTDLATLRGAVSMATQEFCISPQEEQPYWDALDRVEAELARLREGLRDLVSPGRLYSRDQLREAIRALLAEDTTT